MWHAMWQRQVGGLSSRAIVGETGPMHQVKDALALDAKLVPLWRLMARECDREAQALAVSTSSPPQSGTPVTPRGGGWEEKRSLSLSATEAVAEAEQLLRRHFAGGA